MKKKTNALIIILLSVLTVFFTIYSINKTSVLEAVVVNIEEDILTVRSNENIDYSFEIENINVKKGADIVIEYRKGLNQKNKIIKYSVPDLQVTSQGVPVKYLDNGIFSDYYSQAINKLNEMSLDEKIGQMFLVRYPDNNVINDLHTYKFGGFVFFEKDFKNKNADDVEMMITNVQEVANIPLLTAVDEEGGKVVRISSNPNLSLEKFKSSQELYSIGGLNAIKEDTVNKSKLLSNLGINLNLAPVVDVTQDESDYMYKRSLGENAYITSKYANVVIEASKGLKVSYTLKHFPGYGNNLDTHTGKSIDSRTYEQIQNNDLIPFKSGIEVGCEAIMVSHNIVSSIDSSSPASLSPRIHELLRDDMNFTGIIITDDIAMKAIDNEGDAAVKAVLAGNDIIITTDYVASIENVKNAIENEIISEDMIDRAVFRIIAWKYYKGLLN